MSDGTSQTLLIADKRLNCAELGQWQEDDNGVIPQVGTKMRCGERNGCPPTINGPGDGNEQFDPRIPDPLMRPWSMARSFLSYLMMDSLQSARRYDMARWLHNSEQTRAENLRWQVFWSDR
jgi:hypothetical protein